jgi:hypothetical protein
MPSLKAMAKEVKNRIPAAPQEATKKVSQPHNLSTEFVQESDDEDNEKSEKDSSSDDEELLPENAAMATSSINGKVVGPALDNSSSNGNGSESAESDSEDDEDEDKEPVKSVRKTPVVPEPAT